MIIIVIVECFVCPLVAGCSKLISSSPSVLGGGAWAIQKLLKMTQTLCQKERGGRLMSSTAASQQGTVQMSAIFVPTVDG